MCRGGQVKLLVNGPNLNRSSEFKRCDQLHKLVEKLAYRILFVLDPNPLNGHILLMDDKTGFFEKVGGLYGLANIHENLGRTTLLQWKTIKNFTKLLGVELEKNNLSWVANFMPWS